MNLPIAYPYPSTCPIYCTCLDSGLELNGRNEPGRFGGFTSIESNLNGKHKFIFGKSEKEESV